MAFVEIVCVGGWGGGFLLLPSSLLPTEPRVCKVTLLVWRSNRLTTCTLIFFWIKHISRHSLLFWCCQFKVACVVPPGKQALIPWRSERPAIYMLPAADDDEAAAKQWWPEAPKCYIARFYADFGCLEIINIWNYGLLFTESKITILSVTHCLFALNMSNFWRQHWGWGRAWFWGNVNLLKWNKQIDVALYWD